MAKEFVESEGEHWYQSPTQPGVWYPSVTTVLQVWPKGEGFARYLANQPSWEDSQRTLKAAGERGTKVHQGAELLERGQALQRDQFSLQEWRMLMGFVAWHLEYKPRAIAIERRLVSDSYRTGGTVDRVYDMEIDGERVVVVVDLKTSKAIHDSHWIQTAVYRQLAMAERLAVPTHVAILRLTDKGKKGYEFKVEGAEEADRLFKAFESAQAIWEHTRPGAGPVEIEVPAILTLR